jgi:transposase
MLDVAKSLPEDPDELRQFTALLLAEVKSQAVLIHCPAGHLHSKCPERGEAATSVGRSTGRSTIALQAIWCSQICREGQSPVRIVVAEY